MGVQNELNIHFIWLIWKLNYRLELRKKIKKGTEAEKELIAKHLGLENPFLLKRQINIGFRNLIYTKISEKPKIKREIIGRFYHIWWHHIRLRQLYLLYHE